MCVRNKILVDDEIWKKTHAMAQLFSPNNPCHIINNKIIIYYLKIKGFLKNNKFKKINKNFLKKIGLKNHKYMDLIIIK